ncbi:MAG: hypothetical protein CMA72_06415 [Euryarchaeota archaeon]|jgi:choline kinase|nr:hypothetical protein [Euryarchaeota archaeon]|tara:strand:- start:216 stop:980 length:765 start_codon:yes stop_codon:yes gene_type:complete
MPVDTLKVIILAAGMSSRLGELTVQLPKSCLPIDGRITMLERNLQILEQCGFESAVVVTGHAGSVIEDFVKHRVSSMHIETLSNNEFATMNNIYTCYLVRDILDDSTLIMNSDLVVSKRIIQLAVDRMKVSEKSFMMVDDHNQVDEESMKVYVNTNGIVTRVNKSLDIEESAGEYIGILRLSKTDIVEFVKSTEDILRNGGTDMYYEDAIDRATGKLAVYCVSTDGVLWTEIDTLSDYNAAIQIANDLRSEIMT